MICMGERRVVVREWDVCRKVRIELMRMCWERDWKRVV